MGSEKEMEDGILESHSKQGKIQCKMEFGCCYVNEKKSQRGGVGQIWDKNKEHFSK